MMNLQKKMMAKSDKVNFFFQILMDICQSGFQHLLDSISETGNTNTFMTFIEVFLPKQFVEKAQDIITNKSITDHYSAKTKREIWTITPQSKGSNDLLYYVYLENDNYYCSCPSFTHDVIHQYQYPFCKHVLATLICKAYKKSQLQTLPFRIQQHEEEEFSNFLLTTLATTNLGKPFTHIIKRKPINN